MKTLFIFAGQGYRNANLFTFFQQHQAALSLLGEFSHVADFDFLQSDLPLSDPTYTQLIIGTYQLTLFALLKPLFNNQSIELAGYSLGEVSAFLASIGASPPQSVATYRYRTQLMSSLVAQNYDLLAITGIFDLDELKIICAQHQCAVAIINAPQHVVLAGKITDLKLLLAALQQYPRLHAQFLEIHLPSHTPFYADKQGMLQQFLSNHLKPDSLHYSIISPIELMKISNANQECLLLDQELFTTLQWNYVCELIHEYQYDLIIDLGPGTAMTALLTAINPELTNVKVVSAALYASFDGLCNALKPLLHS